jgi:hypothetical protein
MANYFSQCCGTKANSISSLLSRHCDSNPSERRHLLYEAGRKPNTIANTAVKIFKPDGFMRRKNAVIILVIGTHIPL